MTRHRRAGLLLLPLCVLSGCLFVGEINERPSASLDAEPGTTLGRPLNLVGEVLDDQEGGSLEITVRDETGAEVSDPCTLALTTLFGDAANPHYQMTIWRPGTYTILATPYDVYRAKGPPSTAQVTVGDAPPFFSRPTQQLAEGSPPTACTSLHPAGRPIPIRLDGEAIDPETDPFVAAQKPPPGCPQPSPLTLTWRITGRPAGSNATLGTAYTDGSCPVEAESPSASLVSSDHVVCLYPDGDLPTGMPSTYTLELDIDDGTSVVPSAPLKVSVIGNAAACLDGTYPATGAYVLPRDQATVFQALGVDDVTDGSSLEFVWSIEREGEAGFSPIGPSVSGGDGGARYVLDPVALGLAVGDKLRLRVEVADPGYAGAACAADDDVCTAASCAAAPATTCPRRAAWSLEIR